jgi:hypothetical protein
MTKTLAIRVLALTHAAGFNLRCLHQIHPLRR